MTRARDIANFGDGIATADIGDGQITTAKIASGAITDALLPAGSVLQVVQTVKSDAGAFTSTSAFQDLTGLSVTITPSSASNKILITCNVHFTHNSDNNSVAFRVLREATPVGVGVGDGARKEASFMDAQQGGGDHLQSANYCFLDSPSTTSATTYKIQLAGEGGSTVNVNRNTNSNLDNSDPKYARPISSITVMEIAG